MLGQTSFLNLLNATSSQASADGVLPSALQAGPTTCPSGPDPALANLSARQAQALGLTTSATFGPRGIISFHSAALQSSLESKLAHRMRSLGSILFRLTWKERLTPSGRAISALRAQARPISGKGFSLRLASWQTASARDWKDSAGMAQTRPDGRSRLDQLPRQALLSTLSATDEALRRIDLSGAPLTGSAAPMIFGGLLNPAHSRWLMGYPPAWDDCALMGMQSSRNSRKRSSKARSSRSSKSGPQQELEK